MAAGRMLRVRGVYHLVGVYYFDVDSREPVVLYEETGAPPEAYRIAELLFEGKTGDADRVAERAGLKYLDLRPEAEEDVILVFTAP